MVASSTSSSSQGGSTAGTLPDALLDYIRHCPLPAFVFPAQIQSPPSPNLTNEAASVFLGTRTFLDALPAPDKEALERFLHASDGSERLTVTFGGQVKAAWQRWTFPGGIVLTAVAPLPPLRKDSKVPILTNEQLLASIHEAPHGYFTVDLHGQMIWASDSWRRFVGIGSTESLDSWGGHILPEDLPGLVDWVKRSTEVYQPTKHEFRWKKLEDDGRHTWTICSMLPVLDENGKATHYTGTVVNISKQKTAELEALKAAERDAKRLAETAEAERAAAVEEKQQQEFLIDVTSHELRNPISAILQTSEHVRASLDALRIELDALERDSVIPHKFSPVLKEEMEALEAITSCALSQERVCNDILGMAQMERGSYQINPIEFDITKSLQSLVAMFRVETRSRDIELGLHLGPTLALLGPHARVLADPNRLNQVLVNLLVNAIRFTAQSKIKKIWIEAEVSAERPAEGEKLEPPTQTDVDVAEKQPVYLHFAVVDTGPGMTHEQCGVVFERFMQASPLTQDRTGHNGLGLWIARNLCDMQKGRIEVESQVGEGTTFRGFITAEAVHGNMAKMEEEGELEDLPYGGTRIVRPSATDGELLKGMTVLCCDDNKTNREIMQKQLLKRGCTEVLFGEDGKHGLEMLEKDGQKTSVVIMDFHMPNMDGLAATKEIRKKEKHTGGAAKGKTGDRKLLRIIGLTGDAREEQKRVGIEAGMDVVLSKPYRIQDLLNAILDRPAV